MTYPRHDGDIPPMGRPYGRAYPSWMWPCVSKTDVRRDQHEADKDGRCVFCDKKVRR